MIHPLLSPTVRESLRGAALSAAALLCLAPTASAQGSPNVLFFFLDDMRWDAASFTGSDVITTPNMDTLAAQGTVVENAFTTPAICITSRASVFSGQHMQRHGITSFGSNLSSSQWANCYPGKLDVTVIYELLIRDFLGTPSESKLPQQSGPSSQ